MQIHYFLHLYIYIIIRLLDRIESPVYTYFLQRHRRGSGMVLFVSGSTSMGKYPLLATRDLFKC
jgi:hypothetical protein